MVLFFMFAVSNVAILKFYKNICTNRAGGTVKTRRPAGGGCGDSWHEKWISLMGDGHLGAQGDLVDRAGDTVSMVPRYTQHT